jgi:Cdc6-like AAA superfamily ATPase
VVCLDEVDKLEETDIIYDLTRPTWNSSRIQIIGISNNPLIFKNLDPRTKSRLFPVEEIYFNPYTQEELKSIIKTKAEDAFKYGVVDKEAIDYLAKYTFEKKGDMRIVKQTLLCAGDLAINLDDKKIDLYHVKEKLNRTRHAKSIRMINQLSQHEKFILKLIPNQGTYYPKLYNFYKSTDGKLGDRMFRNYIERFYKLRLINIEKKGVGGSYFITLNTPKNVLFEIS